MRTTEPATASRLGKRARTAGALLAWAFVFVAFTASPAGAQGGCGEISFSFDGTRLLNDGISNTAGPFPAEIPAGEYTVTLIAADEHDTQVGVASQSGEQYRVVLDSGYISPLSTDIPDDVNSSTTVFNGQQIGESTSISVEHGGADGINSVDVVCVGFDPVAEPESNEEATEEGDDSETPADADPSNTDDAPAEPTEPEATDDVPAEPTEPEDTDDAPAEPTEPEDADGPEEEPVQDIGEPVEITRDTQPVDEADDATASEEETAVLDESIINDDGPDEPGDDEVSSATPDEEVEVVEVEVLGETEQPVVPLLAITGPDDRAVGLVGLALLLIFMGWILLDRERRVGSAR